jgi:hypothetical protein
MKLKLSSAAFAAAAMLCLASASNATPIGTLTISDYDCGGGTGVRVYAAAIDFLPLGGGTGCIQTGGLTNVTYVNNANAADSLGPSVLGTINDLPVNGPAEFLKFATDPDLHFTLTALGPGLSDTTCENSFLGQCSVAGSPIWLIGNGSTTTAILPMAGLATDFTGSSQFTGSFSTELNLTPFQIQQAIVGGGFVQSTYSGRLDMTLGSQIPEPASMLLLGSGLLGIAVFSKKKFKKA